MEFGFMESKIHEKSQPILHSPGCLWLCEIEIEFEVIFRLSLLDTICSRFAISPQ
jgi:hypothetical protein